MAPVIIRAPRPRAAADPRARRRRRPVV